MWAFALSWALGRLKGALGLFTRHPWQCALAASLLACAWIWHGKGVVERREVAEKAAYAATIARQDAAIAQWQAEGQARQVKAVTALATVKQANRPLIAQAAQIERTAPPATIQSDCRTAPEVMAAKELL